MKKLHMTNNYALINFDATINHNSAEIISSKGFNDLFTRYIRHLRRNKSYLLNGLEKVSIPDVLALYKLLLVYDLDDALKQVPTITQNEVKKIYDLTEDFYDFWRNFQRYGLIKGSKNYDPSIKIPDVISINNEFNTVVIDLYRTIAQKLRGSNYHVFRQLPAGVNATMLYTRHQFTKNKVYQKIQNIPFITKVLLSPPFIINTKSNTRTGLFTQIDENPLPKLNIIKNQYLAFAIKVGPLLAFVYVHRDFIHHGISLSNLFEFANYQDFKHQKPDLVYIYGIKEEEYDNKYYIDTKKDIYVGFVSRADKNDYFGYIKKMLLTLHNVYMINHGFLPIHGAMVRVVLNNKEVKNVAIIGDSGAGKSETLEALRIIGKDKITDMKVVFDDMGTFKLIDNKIVANGTETGAFVRLDDLDTGYAYQIMDRALFLNPNKVNARVLVPISSYNFIMKDHPVDYLFYANNYLETDEGIKIFDNLDDALNIFRSGKRKAKGTTSEVGLVKSYFANPFGPVQMQAETEVLLNKYFNNLKDNGTVIGELYTRLAVDGFETEGPLKAARAMLKYIENK